IGPGASGGGARDECVRRRRGVEPVRYDHPSLEPVLRESYGVMLFEDDCLLAVEALTGLPAPEADRLRRLLADPDTAAEGAQLFVAACQADGAPRPAARPGCSPLGRVSG